MDAFTWWLWSALAAPVVIYAAQELWRVDRALDRLLAAADDFKAPSSVRRWPSRLFIARIEPGASPSDNRNISLRHESTC